MNPYGREYLRVMDRVIARGTAAWISAEILAESITDEQQLRDALQYRDAGEVTRAVTRAHAFAERQVSVLEHALLLAMFEEMWRTGADTASTRALISCVRLVTAIDPPVDDVTARAALLNMARKGWIGLLPPQGDA